MRIHALAAGAAAVGSGLTIAMVGISPAVAGPVKVHGISTTVVTAAATVPVNDIGEADATCPHGELLLGGGYAVNSTSTDWRIYLDEPSSGGAWVVEPVNLGTEPLSFSAYAICASMPGKKGKYTTHVVSTAFTAPANDTAEAEAQCPVGELRTGGGYEVTNVSSNWSVYVNAPFSSNIWNVEIDNEVTSTTVFHASAVCLARTDAEPVTKLTISTVYTAATAPAFSVQTADASCGSKELMTGGGHEIDSIGPYWSIEVSAPVSANDWRIQVADLDSYSRVFDSYALCLANA